MEKSGQLHAVAALPPAIVSGAQSVWGWVGPGTGLDVVEKG